MYLDRLDEPNAMAPTSASETVISGLKHVFGHNSTQRAFQKVSFGDSESSPRALRAGANGAFGAKIGHVFRRNKSLGVGGVGRAPLAQTVAYLNIISGSLRSPKLTP